MKDIELASYKKKRQPPSRQRYEEEHPTVSFRLDKETHRRLTEHLSQSGCSLADFVKDALGREESMVKERVEMVSKQKVPPSFEERLRYNEDLTYQAALYCYNQGEPPLCPRCPNHKLILAWGYQMGSTDAKDFIPLLKCPKCGYYPDTYRRVNPKTIEWSDLGAAKSDLKPKSPPKKKKR